MKKIRIGLNRKINALNKYSKIEFCYNRLAIQHEVSHYMSDGALKVKADIEKTLEVNVARD